VGINPELLRNLMENPKVAVLVADRQATDGYQIKGTAEVLTILDLAIWGLVFAFGVALVDRLVLGIWEKSKFADKIKPKKE